MAIRLSSLLVLLVLVAYGQQTRASRIVICTDTASATDAYTCNPSPTVTAYTTVSPLKVLLFVNTDNAGAASLAISGLAAIPIKDAAGADPISGDLKAGHFYELVYSSGVFQMLSQRANVGGSGGSTPDTVLYNPSVYKWALFSYQGSGTALTGIGDIVNAQGTGTVGTLGEGIPAHINYASTATTNSYAGAAGNLMWRTGRDIKLYTSVMFVETNTLNAFIGLTTGGIAGVTTSPITTGRYMGFRYTAGTDTNWACVQDNNTGTITTGDSGIAVDTWWHKFRIWLDLSGATVKYYIDDSLVCSLNSNFPGVTLGTNNNLQYVIGERTLENVIKNVRIAYIYMQANIQ